MAQTHMITTRTGLPLEIRTASVADVEILADIYGHLTAQDMRFRFKQPIEALQLSELATLVDQGCLSFDGDDED